MMFDSGISFLSLLMKSSLREKICFSPKGFLLLFLGPKSNSLKNKNRFFWVVYLKTDKQSI